ncbi:MAG: type II toxin-antitoxin system VapC family toxin [Saprospiraceae bacterium]|nr:type II toxin-antitoxin system VapC family toxin [Pyrinomonadaceae bacterium]
MRYLLDTHTFIWKIADTGKIPAKVLAATENPDNEVFLSSVSLWEIAIKTRRKKLDLGGVNNEELIGLAEKMGIQTLSLMPQEAVTYGNLTEDTHFDPFDRMLIWQAISRKMVLVSGDSEFSRFKKDGLRLLWK